MSVIQKSRLKKLIHKFPQFKKVASSLNRQKINWALAAGSALYIYYGGEQSLDDVDIWIAEADREKTAKILNRKWLPQLSDRHLAENIQFDGLDIFTNCRKFEDEKPLLDYRFTSTVAKHLKKIEIDGVVYYLVSPEDIVVLKIPIPRGDKEIGQIKRIIKMGLDNDYLLQRLRECRAAGVVYERYKKAKSFF